MLRHFAADGEDVFHLAVVGVRPKMVAVRGLDELRGDAQFVTSLGDAAFEQMTHVQELANFLDVLVLAFERE